MAITNAQQAKQILMEDGGPVVQAGVKNYKPSKICLLYTSPSPRD